MRIVNLLGGYRGLPRTNALATRARSTREKVSSVLGFTLIELLMVMAVMGVMTTIFIITFPAAQKRARDTQRKNDLKQLQTALEAAANKNDGLYYRRSDLAGEPTSTLCVTDLGYSANECPVDPRDGQAVCDGSTTCRYFYQTESCGLADGETCATQYVLWGALEQPVVDEYWVLCSNGVTGEVAAGSMPPGGGNCPI